MADQDEIATYRLQPRSHTSSTSSVNLPSGRSANGKEMSERRDISSTYLQERLKERRTETLKVKKQRRDSESTADDASRVGSSPTVASSNGRLGDRRPTTSSAASEKKNNMGAKGMEEAMDKLQKQNWDFKLEIYHRRQKQEALEEKNAALEDEVASLKEKLARAESNNVELQTMNDEVMSQLEVHDQAVEEAVKIICDLEANIELLEKEKSSAQSFAMGLSIDPRSSPPILDYLQPETKARSEPAKLHAKPLKRMPSFLSDHSRSTEALRSLFRPSNVDLPKLAEEVDNAESEDSYADGRHSPQLSVLSESSFMSVYAPDRSISPVEKRKEAQVKSTVKAWIDERPVNYHLKPSPGSLLPRHDREKYLSVDYAASSPIRRIDDIKHRMEHALRNTKGVSNSYPSKNEPDMSRKSSASSANIQPYAGKFHHDRMPPTPDTLSITTLRHQQNSYDTFSKNSGSEDDKNIAALRFYAYSDEASNIVPRSRSGPLDSRPRTAEETATSLRDTHSWDKDRAKLGEDGSGATDPWLASAQEFGPPKRTIGVEPPRMFDFSSRDDWSPEEAQSNAHDLMFHDNYASDHGTGQPVLTSRSVGTSLQEFGPPKSGDIDGKQAAKVDVKDSKITPFSKQRYKPAVSLKTDSRPPLSHSNKSHTSNSNPTTPSTEASELGINRKGSLSKRSRLHGLLGGRSETVPNISSYAAEKTDETPSRQPSQRSQTNRFQKKSNTGSDKIPSSPPRNRRNPLVNPLLSGHPGPSGTSVTKDHIRRASGLPTTSGSRKMEDRPSTSGSLDSRLPVPVSAHLPSKSRNMDFSSINDYNNRGRNHFGGDGANDDFVYERNSMDDENTPADGDISNSETKIGKIKGVVLKTFGRR